LLYHYRAYTNTLLLTLLLGFTQAFQSHQLYI